MSEDIPIRDAATAVLLRDGADGLETFLLRRTHRTVFASGAHVFPGGAVDAADADQALYARCDGLDDASASKRLGRERDGLSFWTAAIRECFEEAGLLFASADGDDAYVDLDADLEDRRAALNADETTLAEVCAARDLRLPVAALRYYSFWITPAGEPKRYATRFFAAVAPPGQTGRHDGRETVAGGWIHPAEALRRQRAGEFFMLPPTHAQLQFLKQYPSAAAVLAELDAMDGVPTVTGDRVELDESGGIRKLIMRSRLDHG